MTLEPRLGTNAARFNLRDYGGYRTSFGSRLRSGLLFRSAQLDGAGPDERELLRRLGIGVVVDLRSANEIPVTRSVAYAGFGGPVLVAQREDGVIPHAIRGLTRLATPQEAVAKMVATYRLLPSSHRFREALGLYLQGLLDVEGGSLIHCFAGKDRTGLAVALFQLLLGVHADDVMSEYLLTNSAGEERVAAGVLALKTGANAQMNAGVNEDVLREAMGVRPEYLAAALTVIGADNESPASWLVQVAGLGGCGPERLRERYTV